LSCAKPVVATEIVGVAEEVKERDAGIIIKPRDVEALANGITYLMQDPTMAKKMGKNGRKLVEEKYRWERIAIKTEEVYFSALK
jgi:glycosyltransferase involved in cell wall biosynthesis